MIVLGITAILATLAVPNYLAYLANDRAANLATQLNNMLRLAKNEAIHQGLTVEVCALRTAGGTICDENATTWQYGWQIVVPATGQIIRSYQPNSANAVSINPAGSLNYSPNGFPVPQDFTFTIKPSGCTQGYTIGYSASILGGPLKILTVTCP